MKTKLLTIAAFTIGAALSANAGLVDLTAVGASGTINGAIYQQISPSSTGTGIIDPFVQIAQSGNEGAYNTEGTLPAPFAQFGSGNWNDDLLLTSVPQVTVGANTYYQFLLDVNESGNTPQDNAKITLNQVQIYQTAVPSQTGGTIEAATGRLLTSGPIVTTPFIGTLAYDMNMGGGSANYVVLDYGLNAGSGSGDMFLYVPVGAFTPANGQYVVLYSHFGDPPGAFSSTAGFEEWATLTPIPEPTTVIAGSLLLLPFAASMFRRFRRNA